jgi:hypothetical protein
MSHILRACALAALLSLLSFAPHGAVEVPVAATRAHTHGSVTYAAAWGENTAANDAAGWQLQNNLGYRVQVNRITLVNAAVQLLPCPATASASAPYAPRRASAGHGANPTETRWAGPNIEHVQLGSDRVLGTATLGDGPYCSVHYLLAAIGEQPSLAVTGAYLPPNESAWQAFSIRSTLAWGAYAPLPAPTRQHSTVLRVTVVRDMDRLFDGVDFAQQSDDERARQVLRMLTSNLVVRSLEETPKTRPNNTYHD